MRLEQLLEEGKGAASYDSWKSSRLVFKTRLDRKLSTIFGKHLDDCFLSQNISRRKNEYGDQNTMHTGLGKVEIKLSISIKSIHDLLWETALKIVSLRGSPNS